MADILHEAIQFQMHFVEWNILNFEVSIKCLYEGRIDKKSLLIRGMACCRMASKLVCHISYYMNHYNDVIMSAIASQITSLAIVYSTVYSDAVQRKHQSSAWLAFVWGIHLWPVNSPHKGPITRKMIPFDDVIMIAMRNYWWKENK